MGKKKGKKTAGAEEKTEAEISNTADCIEANGDHAAVPRNNRDDDVTDEIAQLSLDKAAENDDPGDNGSSKKKKKKNKQAERESPEPQDEGENDQPEFFEPSDDERSKKKKQRNKKAERESPEPQEEGDDNQPEFFEPSDDERSKKKKKKKEKQQPTRQSPEPTQDMENNEPEFFEPSDDEKKKKQKKKAEHVEEKAEDGEEQETSTVKTKAQRLAEKKERERKKKQEKARQGAKSKGKTGEAVEKSEEDKVKDSEDVPETEGLDAVEEKTSKKKKKDKKEKKGEIDAKSRKKPGNKAIAAMQEALRKQKEEEERLKQEEDEKERKEEEARQERIDKLEEEKMRKERKKQKAKERIKRLKAEGKYLTPTQKEAQRKREAYVESLRQQGLLPVSNKQKPKYDNLSKTMKKNRQSPVDEKAEDAQAKEGKEVVEKEEEVAEMMEEAAEDDDIADDWEAVLEDSEEVAVEKDSLEDERINEDDGAEEEEEEDSDEESEEESSEEESEEEEDDLTPRQRAERRIELRKGKNEQNRNTDDLRSPVICVMGHVDTGKTKILDKIRHSHVQDGEAGGITQQIGATFVPLETIREQTSMVKSFQESNVTLPGLLIIDTPGHESFSNLRSRGSSVCDMAILVVDIMHGLESQTVESINMLKKRKTPFVVALNKVDRLYDWKRGPDSDIVNTLKKQKRHVKEEFEEKVREIVVEFAKENLNVKLFNENDDPKEWISMVPTSAHSGDGMGNLIALVMQLCQTMLPKRLAFSEELQCTVLEVKQIPGLGTTIDLILTNGRLNYGDTIVLAGVEGPIVSHIKALLMPQPLKEMRVKNPYNKFKNLKAAQGVKILAKDLDKALAGTQLLVAHNDDEIEILKAEVQAEVEKTLKSIKLQERGVFVQASTLGSLEALLEFLKQSKIPFAGIGIGPVHKKDIMKASVMLEHDSQWAVILAFDVKVERETQEFADSLKVRIFTADIIYHLFDAFMQHREDLKKQKQEEFRNIAVFPCKLRIMPNCVFKSRDPIIVGVTIDAGQLRRNTPICIPSKEFLMVGYVTGLEFNHKQLEIARAGQEVCIKIEGTPGEPPKMVGRHFEETDILVSKISRDSINALKNWFRDEMQKSDWQLIIELKKMFEIM